MKKILLPALLLFTLCTFAQQDSFTRFTDSLNTANRLRGSHDTICRFYAAKGLCVDSAQNPQLFAEAYYWLGTRYRYSGKNSKGIDCSGFAKLLYGLVYGIQLNGGSASLYKVMQPVGKDSLKEGDMVFFRIRKGRISHVGVYLGNNKFVHASVHGGVMINDLDEEYYHRYFFNGGRMKTRQQEK